MKTLEERFWSKVQKSEGCWLWTAGGAHGYGVIQVGTWRRKKNELAHRVAWELTNGPVPTGLHVCHKCDVPLCVRPDHLFVGADLDNHQDKVAKGRQPRGEQMVYSILTEEQVREIRKRYQPRPTYRQLADEYGVSMEAIRAVVLRRNWQHVE